MNVETIGIYLLKIERDEIRLSYDATNLLKEQINKNIFEISETQAEKWLRGQDLELENKDKDLKGLFVIKFKDDFLGCGKASQERLRNFVPKERRIKSK